MISHPNIKRVALGPILSGHFHALFDYRNDEDVRKWCRQNDLLTEEGHRKWFFGHQTDPKIKMYTIINPEAERHDALGVCGLTDLDLVNGRAEFSLYIAPEHQGEGLGKAALQLLVWHGFNAYPLNQIYGESYAGNPAQRMFREVGFKDDGFRREFYYRDGVYVDAYLFSIKKEELKIG